MKRNFFSACVALFCAGLFVFASCQNELSSVKNIEYGSLTVNEASVRSVYASGISSAVVTVKGYDSEGNSFSKSSGVTSVSGGTASGITIKEIPVTKNAVVLVQAYSDSTAQAKISGYLLSAVTDIASGNGNSVSVTWVSSAKGTVYSALLDSGVNTNTLSEENISLIEQAIPSDSHSSLINAAQIASDYKSSSLKASSNYVLTAGSVNVTCNDYDECTLQLSDPLSSSVTASTSNSVSITNVAPGTWTLYVLSGTTVKATKSVTVTSGGTASVTVGTKVVTDRIIVHVAESSNSTYNPKAYGHIWVWATTGSTNYCTNSQWPGDALSDSDNDGWYDYTIMNGSSYVTSSMVILSKNGSPQTENLTISAAGEYWWNGSEFVTENPEAPAEPTAPVVTIKPSDGSKIAVNGSVSVLFDDGNDTITSASVTINGTSYDLGTAAGTWSKPLSELGITSEGVTVSITASVTNSAGTGTASATLTTKESSGVNADFNNLRIYQVMVSSFQDGDSSIGYSYAYGPSGALHGGDLQGIINSIDYISSLGCNALWMTPIFDSSSGSSDEYLNSTGYFTYDYFNIDPKFGTNEKFAELVEKCHGNGIYVILDGVFGHWGAGGAKASPSGRTPTRSNGQYKACDYPASLEFFKEVAQYWIKNYKIDGWRFDQCYQVGLGEYGNGDGDNCYTNGHNYWYEIRTAIREAADSNEGDWGTLGYLVGEHWNGDASIIQSGSVASGSAAGDGLFSCFDFPSRYKLVQSFAIEESKEKSGVSLGEALSYTYQTSSEKGYSHSEGYYPNLFITNHDLVRFGNLLNWKYSETPSSGSYWNHHKVALASLIAYTGPITIYYGDEWGAYVEGYTGPGALGAYNDNAARSTGKISGFTTNEQNLHDYTAKLLEARSEHEALWNGTSSTVTSESSFYVAKKVKGDETIYIAFNTGSSSKTFNASGTDLITGTSYSGTVTVPSLSAVYLLEK